MLSKHVEIGNTCKILVINLQVNIFNFLNILPEAGYVEGV